MILLFNDPFIWLQTLMCNHFCANCTVLFSSVLWLNVLVPWFPIIVHTCHHWPTSCLIAFVQSQVYCYPPGIIIGMCCKCTLSSGLSDCFGVSIIQGLFFTICLTCNAESICHKLFSKYYVFSSLLTILAKGAIRIDEVGTYKIRLLHTPTLT